MINKEDFNELLTHRKKSIDMFTELYNIGFDFCNGKYTLEDNFDKMFDIIIKSHFNEYGVEWVDWFVYDNYLGENGLSAFVEGQEFKLNLENFYDFIKDYQK